MPKSSRKKSVQPSAKATAPVSPKTLPAKASLENLRKQAKSLLKATRSKDQSALAQFAALHPQAGELSEPTLSDAQLVIARSYGFPSWSKLKHQLMIELYSASPDVLKAAANSDALVNRFISLACLNYSDDHASRRDAAREIFSSNPSLSRENIYSAVTVGDIAAVQQLLSINTSLATTRGGPYNWEPLLYATYSRLDSQANEHSTLKVVRLLLQHGADPNAGFLWDRNYLFTALTGTFGEGESGPLHQPEHQFCYELARLLLEAGADPNDGQTLYNRMFTGGTKHLELLFEFGLGEQKNNVWFKRLGDRLGSPAEMLQQQMAWAAKYKQKERMQLLIEHGVDVNGLDTRFHRTPYELALINGNIELAEYLLRHGAVKTSLNDLDAFSAACLKADSSLARSLLAKNPSLLKQLGVERAELLNLAAEADKRDAVRLMVGLGFDPNERKHTAPLHLAAAGGNLELVKLLIELGADPFVHDEEFNATPLGWAKYNERKEVVEFLQSYEK